jgi:hypothetical protein
MGWDTNRENHERIKTCPVFLFFPGLRFQWWRRTRVGRYLAIPVASYISLSQWSIVAHLHISRVGSSSTGADRPTDDSLNDLFSFFFFLLEHGDARLCHFKIISHFLSLSLFRLFTIQDSSSVARKTGIYTFYTAYTTLGDWMNNSWGGLMSLRIPVIDTLCLCRRGLFWWGQSWMSVLVRLSLDAE